MVSNFYPCILVARQPKGKNVLFNIDSFPQPAGHIVSASLFILFDSVYVFWLFGPKKALTISFVFKEQLTNDFFSILLFCFGT